MIKIKKNINIDKIEDQIVLSKTKNEVLQLDKVFVLEGLSKEIFEDILNHLKFEDILNNILNNYEISKEKAEKDLYSFLNILKEKEIIEIE